MRRRVIALLTFALSLQVLQFPMGFAAQVTSGLLVDMNIANPASYGGSGTTVTDLAGTNNVATFFNGPTYQTTGGTGIVTDGSDDYLEITNTSELQPSIGGVLTLQMWAKVNSFTAGKGLLSKQKGSSGDYDGFSVIFAGTNGLSLYMNGGSVNGNYPSANNVFSLNTWTLFTAVVRFGGGASNQSRLYVNGTQVVAASNSESSIPNNTTPIRLASGIHEGSPYSALKIGAFAMYNRELSVAEINDNYNYYLNYIPDNTPPTITSLSSFNSAENQVAIGTLTANETSTWSLRSSADSGTVNLNATTGVLAFKSAPNFEIPVDSDSNNVYVVTVRATDSGGNSADLNLSITVTDIDERTTIRPTLSAEPKKGVALNIELVASHAGRISVTIQGRRLNSCTNRAIAAAPSQLTCTWKPTVTGAIRVRATFTPSDSNFAPSAGEITALVSKRSNRR